MIFAPRQIHRKCAGLLFLSLFPSTTYCLTLAYLFYVKLDFVSGHTYSTNQKTCKLLMGQGSGKKFNFDGVRNK